MGADSEVLEPARGVAAGRWRRACGWQVADKAFPSPEMLPSATGYTAGDVHSAREMFHPFYL